MLSNLPPPPLTFTISTLTCIDCICLTQLHEYVHMHIDMYINICTLFGTQVGIYFVCICLILFFLRDQVLFSG